MKNSKYLEWLRKQPCHMCGSQAEPHHCIEHGGTAKRNYDEYCVPLCRTHHNFIHNNPGLFQVKKLMNIAESYSERYKNESV